MSLNEVFTNSPRSSDLVGRPRLSYLAAETSLLGEGTEGEQMNDRYIAGQDRHVMKMMAEGADDSTKWRETILSVKRYFNIAVIAALFVGYYVYVGFCLYLNPADSVFVCIIAVAVGVYVLDKVSRRRVRSGIRRLWKSVGRQVKPRKKVAIWIRRVLTLLCVLGIVAFLIYDIQDQWNRYTPLSGLILFILLSLVFSTDARKINWTPVIWGLILQFCLGLLILRWEPGFQACKWVGQQVTAFLAYTDKGSQFVFGDKFTDHPVAFQILPVVVFFSAVINVLYYLGVMQVVIKAIAVILQAALGTTPIESFATAAQIFVGMVECSVTLRPFWKKLTLSEINAAMTSGCATVAGTVIAAYISFGVPAEHVITASFMSAPAALAIAKISMPETAESKVKSQKEIKTPSGSEVNLLEALSAGASGAIKLVAYVVVNLIAFLAVLAFFDAALTYFGSRVNYPQLNFQLICSYVFMPLAAVIGVPWAECAIVGGLIGKKIMINEFLAFIDLGTLIKAREISDYTATVATYCLCGFGSIVAIGINLASLSAAEPSRRSDFARLSVRAVINGNIACFMTACVASLLYTDMISQDALLTAANTTLTNTTLPNVFNVTELMATNFTSSLVNTTSAAGL